MQKKGVVIFNLASVIKIYRFFGDHFFSQFPSLRWPPPRFFGEANRRGFGPQNLNYFSHCRDFIQFRKVSGRSGSKKVHFFSHRFSRKIGNKTGIEIVLGTLFNCGYDACFLIFFFFF